MRRPTPARSKRTTSPGGGAPHPGPGAVAARPVHHVPRGRRSSPRPGGGAPVGALLDSPPHAPQALLPPRPRPTSPPPARRHRPGRRAATSREARPLPRNRQTPHHQSRLRRLLPRPPPRPRRPPPKDAPLPGPRPPSRLPDRRLHRHDRRPHRQKDHPPPAHERRSRHQRRHLPPAGLPHPRPRSHRRRRQRPLARRPRLRRHDPPRRPLHPRAHDGARRLQEPLQGRRADPPPRAALPALPGLRLDRPRGRRRAGRHRPALQPPGRPRPDERRRPRAPGGPDRAAPGRHRRRREDVEEPGQRDRLRGSRRRRSTARRCRSPTP